MEGTIPQAQHNKNFWQWPRVKLSWTGLESCWTKLCGAFDRRNVPLHSLEFACFWSTTTVVSDWVFFCLLSFFAFAAFSVVFQLFSFSLHFASISHKSVCLFCLRFMIRFLRYALVLSILLPSWSLKWTRWSADTRSSPCSLLPARTVLQSH